MKVLLADDEPIARTMLEHWLHGWGYEVVCAKDGQAALDALRENLGIRLAVLDWVMPKLDGVDVCHQLRKEQRDSYVYAILLTAKDDKTDITRGLDAGADDYLTKPISPFELRVRLAAATRVIQLQDALKRTETELARQAMHDALTGVLNRVPALEYLRKEIARGERCNEPISAIVLELDYFEKIRTDRGETVASGLLQQATERLRTAVREYDSIGRLGTAEFLVVLPHCGVEQSGNVATRLQQSLSSAPVTVGPDAFRVTASCGVASTGQRPGARLDQLLRAARNAMQRAVREGCNRVRAAQAPDWVDDKPGVAPSVPAA